MSKKVGYANEDVDDSSFENHVTLQEEAPRVKNLSQKKEESTERVKIVEREGKNAKEMRKIKRKAIQLIFPLGFYDNSCANETKGEYHL